MIQHEYTCKWLPDITAQKLTGFSPSFRYFSEYMIIIDTGSQGELKMASGGQTESNKEERKLAVKLKHWCKTKEIAIKLIGHSEKWIKFW